MLFENSYRGRSVLVTGGASFIGSHLVDRLLELGADVSVVDDLSSGRRNNLPGLSDERLVNLDLADRARTLFGASRMRDRVPPRRGSWRARLHRHVSGAGARQPRDRQQRLHGLSAGRHAPSRARELRLRLPDHAPGGGDEPASPGGGGGRIRSPRARLSQTARTAGAS